MMLSEILPLTDEEGRPGRIDRPVWSDDPGRWIGLVAIILPIASRAGRHSSRSRVRLVAGPPDRESG
jgi:hypothetical protein